MTNLDTHTYPPFEFYPEEFENGTLVIKMEIDPTRSVLQLYFNEHTLISRILLSIVDRAHPDYDERVPVLPVRIAEAWWGSCEVVREVINLIKAQTSKTSFDWELTERVIGLAFKARGKEYSPIAVEPQQP